MSCLATTYPSCPVPTNYFPGAVPSITITKQCCTDAGTVYSFQINGINDLGGPEMWIDGTLRNCIDTSVSSPCFLNDLSGSLAIVSYTTSAITSGNTFVINGTYTIPACGTCVNHTTSLRFFVTGDAATPNLCCYVDVPVTITIEDNSPFTVTPSSISFGVQQGYSQTETFTITNDSCVSETYSYSLSGCSGSMSMASGTVTLAAGATSSPIPIVYNGYGAETGSCTLRVDSTRCSSTDTVNLSYVTYIYDNCMSSDCNILSINGTEATIGCDPICSNMGDSVCVTKTLVFPIRQFPITAADNSVGVNSVSVLGEWAGLVENIQITITDSTCNDGSYIIQSYTYDSVTNTTTIFLDNLLACSTGDGTVNVSTSQENCQAFATLVITNTSTGEEITNTTYTPTGQYIFLDYCFTIPSIGDYSVSLTYGDCFEQYSCNATLKACFVYSYSNTSCHNYRISDDGQCSSGKISTLVISNFDQSYSQSYTIDCTTGSYVDVVFPQDGIYTVTITNNLTPDIYTLVIYDLCDLLTCGKALILDIFCNEVDPCCKDCDEARKEKLRAQRAEVNKLVALMGYLLAYIEKDRLSYLGVFTMDDCRLLNVQEIQSIFDKIKTVTERCGECNSKPVSTINTSPCKSC